MKYMKDGNPVIWDIYRRTRYTLLHETIPLRPGQTKYFMKTKS